MITINDYHRKCSTNLHVPLIHQNSKERQSLVLHSNIRKPASSTDIGKYWMLRENIEKPSSEVLIKIEKLEEQFKKIK